MSRLLLLVSAFCVFGGYSAFAGPRTINGYVCSGVSYHVQQGSSDTGGQFGHIGTQINSQVNCGGVVVANVQFYSTGTTITSAFGFSEHVLTTLFTKLIDARDAGRYLGINCSSLSGGSCIATDLYYY